MPSYRLPDGSVPVLLSADSPEALRREAAAIAAYVVDHAEATADRVADMLFRTRMARRFRALAMVTDRAELITALRAVADAEPHPDVVTSAHPASARRTAYVFPGQGSQRPGMGRMFYDHSPAYRAAVDECDRVFHELYDWSPLTYLLDADAPADDNARTVQPALFMQALGVAAMWQAVGVRPAMTVGHSQGEIPAAYVAGVQTLRDAVRIVTVRATLVDEERLVGYSMAVLGIDREECEDLLARQAGWAELSVINSPHIIAISGERDTVVDVVESLTAAGKFAKEIRVKYPAHTSYLAGAPRGYLARALGDDLDNATFLDGEIDCIGGTFGDRIHAEVPALDYWYLNLRNRVRFDRAIETAAARGADTFVEISEHPTLMLAIQENLHGIAGQREFQALGTSRRGAEGLREFTRNLATVVVHDSNYSWDALRDDTSGDARALPLLDFPNTQMSPRTLWAPYSRTETATAPGADSGLVAPQRLVERWSRMRRRALVPPRTLAVLDPGGRCGELAAAVRSVAPRHGATVVEADGEFDALLVLVPPPSDTDLAAAVDDLAEFLGDRAWPLDTGTSEVWLVTAGGEQVLDTDVPDPFHAAAQAGFRCLAAEHAGVRFRHVDLPAGEDAAVSAKGLLGAVHIAAEPELAVRDGGVYAKRLVVDDATDDPPLDAADLGEVVIVGGTGKLGLDFCERFAAAGARRITLVSRSGGDAAAARRIDGIRDSGRTEVVVRTCDVGDASAVAALADEYRATPADLIVHAAVDYATMAESDDAAVRAGAAAKIVALDNLVRHFPLAADGRIVLCSSLSATLGGRGHTAYSAVNRLLDAAAARYRAQGIHCVSVQWGLWRAVGADHADALARIVGTGLLPMDPAAAVAAGFRKAAANVLVVAARWSRVRELFAVYGFQPLFAELPEDAPSPVPTAPEPPAEPQPPESVANPPAVVPESADTAETVRHALRTVMGLGRSESIDGSVPLVALGLDSIQALDLRKRIEADLRRDLPVTAILGGASLDEVVSLLA
ncbi:nocobactin polyketide synthase NbtC [Nocardia sp. CDC159]|uniref:Nocobactin polyketide synthase NbtC n=1 Tax=Nocardia pulmonis TaxID=2951408 RepID=A0A9X2E830_9NOCA|nr:MULTISPECIES: nocobactin polyketide synthase NbtC [Nocardia]MCM6776037.1 nocobactin polyketide synthase NbtC [Nocardia pulmonis]MCM6788636.1 nocobactin polyketide synthase NbtC [Nocardia sp. CDC159]